MSQSLSFLQTPGEKDSSSPKPHIPQSSQGIPQAAWFPNTSAPPSCLSLPKSYMPERRLMMGSLRLPLSQQTRGPGLLPLLIGP